MNEEIKNNEVEKIEPTTKTKAKKTTTKKTTTRKTTKATKEAPVVTENTEVSTEQAVAEVPAEKTTNKKATTKKTVAKKEIEKSQNIYIEYQGKQIEQQDIINRVKDAWAQSGHRITSIKTLNIYIKPEDNAVYYVVNGKPVKEPIYL